MNRKHLILIFLFLSLLSPNAFGQANESIKPCRLASKEIAPYRNLRLGMKVKTPEGYKNTSFPHLLNGSLSLIKNAEELGWFMTGYTHQYHSGFDKIDSIAEDIDKDKLLLLEIAALDNSLVYYFLQFENKEKSLQPKDWVRKLSQELKLPEDGWEFFNENSAEIICADFRAGTQIESSSAWFFVEQIGYDKIIAERDRQRAEHIKEKSKP